MSLHQLGAEDAVGFDWGGLLHSASGIPGGIANIFIPGTGQYVTKGVDYGVDKIAPVSTPTATPEAKKSTVIKDSKVQLITPKEQAQQTTTLDTPIVSMLKTKKTLYVAGSIAALGIAGVIFYRLVRR